MESPKHLCQSCHCLVGEDDHYCSVCGQKKIDKTVSIRELTGDFISSLFSLDTKVIRTFGTLLFRPGKLTTEYLAGRRQLYYPPFRLFLFCMTLAFILFALTNPIQHNYKNSYNAKLELETYKDSLKKELYLAFPDSNHQQTIDTIIPDKDVILVELDTSIFELSSGTFSMKDIFLLEEDAILKKAGVEGFWKTQLARKLIKTIKKLEDFKVYLLGHLSWIILISIPFIALWLRLLYIRQKRTIIEHIVYVLHMHTFLFVLLILLFLSKWLDIHLGLLVPLLFFPAFILYIFFSVKHVYQQSTFMTIVKIALFSLGYSFIMSFSVSLFLLLVFALF